MTRLSNITMQDLVQTLLARPDAKLVIDKIEQSLVQEEAQRLHFYKTIDENKKMEFINGHIYFHSPVKRNHNEVTGRLYMLIKSYILQKAGGFLGIEKIMVSLTRNDYEPDICYFLPDKAKAFKQDQMQFPAPDFVVEVISTSTEKHDRGLKFDDYAAHGVQEYWLIDPRSKTCEQYVLHNQQYVLEAKGKSGNLKSQVIKGMELPIAAIFDDVAAITYIQELMQKP